MTPLRIAAVSLLIAGALGVVGYHAYLNWGVYRSAVVLADVQTNPYTLLAIADGHQQAIAGAPMLAGTPRLSLLQLINQWWKSFPVEYREALFQVGAAQGWLFVQSERQNWRGYALLGQLHLNWAVASPEHRDEHIEAARWAIERAVTLAPRRGDVRELWDVMERLGGVG